MPKAKGTRGGGKKQGSRWADVEPRNTSPTRVEMHIAIARIAPSENLCRSREDSQAPRGRRPDTPGLRDESIEPTRYRAYRRVAAGILNLCRYRFEFGVGDRGELAKARAGILFDAAFLFTRGRESRKPFYRECTVA